MLDQDPAAKADTDPAGSEGKGTEGEGDKAAAEAKAKADAEAAAKAKEGEPKPGAPEKYEAFKVPEGTPLFDEAFTGKYSAIAKELGLPQEAAQKMVDFLVGEAKDAETRTEEYYKSVLEDRKKEWIAALKKDKEFGGANYSENRARAEAAFSQYDKALGGELTKFIKDNYLEGNPTLTKFFLHLNKATAEDTFVEGKKPKGGEKTVDEILYPDGWDKKQGNQ